MVSFAGAASRPGRSTKAPCPTGAYELSSLATLEAESIFIIREVAAEFERPVLLFSGGKDSAVLLHLARKAFWPSALPLPLLHVDTGHNFPEVLDFRDRVVGQLGARLIVASVATEIAGGRLVECPGVRPMRNSLQTSVLLAALAEGGFDAALGGARRDEERSRAKERVFSFRDEFGQWDPKNQRPELWNLYNGRHQRGQHIRVFPLSNWTELDVWRFIEQESLLLPSIYFAHRREVVTTQDGLLLGTGPVTPPLPGESVDVLTVRYRTVGDMTCTAAVESQARTVAEIIAEITTSRVTERGAGRVDDRASDAAMEDRKREGYF